MSTHPEAPLSPTADAADAAHPAATKAADALAEASRTLLACPPVQSLFAPASDGGPDIDGAYAAQTLHVHRSLAAGRRLTGRKIGLTSPAVQGQLGVDQPDFGALFADMAVGDGGRVAPGRLLQPKVEAEVVLVLGADLPGSGCTPQDVRRATAYALPALEIVDSRIADWRISIVDTVADNASCGLYVLGEDPVDAAELDFEGVEMAMTRSGETVSTGTGADCLGSPLTAAAWLAHTLAERGDPLRAGEVVLTGALGPMVPAAPGDRFVADLTQLGRVSVEFATEPTSGPRTRPTRGGTA